MLSDLRIRFRSLFRRATVEDELDDELRSHVDQQVEKYMRAGMSRKEALRRVRLEFGGIEQVREDCRDARGVSFFESLAQDLRYAVRQMRKSPAFTLLTMLIMILGIGINTAIFSLVYHVLLEPLSFPQANQLFAIWALRCRGKRANRIFRSGLSRLPRSHQVVFEDRGTNPSLYGYVDRRRRTQVDQLHWSFGGFLFRIGRSPVYVPLLYIALVSYRFWKSQLGGDPHVIGRVIQIGGAAKTIVGLVRPLPDLFLNTEIWPTLPTRPGWDFMQWRKNKFLTVVGRLKPGITVAQAQHQRLISRLAVIWRRS